MPQLPSGNCCRGHGYHLIELLEVAREDPLVVLLLQRAHLDAQDPLILGRQALLHILDHSPQQVRPQLCMQLRQLRNMQRCTFQQFFTLSEQPQQHAIS